MVAVRTHELCQKRKAGQKPQGVCCLLRHQSRLQRLLRLSTRVPSIAQKRAAKKKSKDMRKHKTPGPGSYTPGQHRRNLGKEADSSFTSKTKRMDVTNSSSALDNSGDPGSYDPKTLQELASTQKVICKVAPVGNGWLWHTGGSRTEHRDHGREHAWPWRIQLCDDARARKPTWQH